MAKLMMARNQLSKSYCCIVFRVFKTIYCILDTQCCEPSAGILPVLSAFFSTQIGIRDGNGGGAQLPVR